MSEPIIGPIDERMQLEGEKYMRKVKGNPITRGERMYAADGFGKGYVSAREFHTKDGIRQGIEYAQKVIASYTKDDYTSIAHVLADLDQALDNLKE